MLLTIVVALATARTALACPPGARCVVATPQISEVSGPTPPKKPVSLRVAHVVEREPWTFEAPPPAADTETPWIWQALRTHVADRMPRYRGADNFTFVASPVVVAGAFDTVPGVGIAGDF